MLYSTSLICEPQPIDFDISAMRYFSIRPPQHDDYTAPSDWVYIVKLDDVQI